MTTYQQKDKAKALIEKHGARWHGPHVEHLSMEENAFWAFLVEWTARAINDHLAGHMGTGSTN